MIVGFNTPMENLFGFNNDHLARDNNPIWGDALQKINEIHRKLKTKSTIVPSPTSGMILVMQVTEKDFLEMAQSVNVPHEYDSLTRIGYLGDFRR